MQATTATRTLGQSFAKDFSIAINQLTTEKDSLRHQLLSTQEQLLEEKKRTSDFQQNIKKASVSYCLLADMMF